MLDYARSDTHFLLYCYDKVRNELIARSTPDIDLVGEALINSKETSLKRYERLAYDMDQGSGQLGWASLLKRHPAHFTPEQFAVYKAIHQWRDKVARDEDDSHHYVMPKHQLFNIARQMPEDVPGILGACHPVSPHIRSRMNDLISLIRITREKAQAEMPTPLPVQEVAEVESDDIATPVVPQSSNEPIDIFDANGILRTDQSSFWGQAAGSSKWLDDSAKLRGALADVRLAVPLPQLTAAIFINHNDSTLTNVQSREPGSRVEHEFIRQRPKKPEHDDIIVVKQVGGGKKRKRDKKNVDEMPGSDIAVKTEDMEDEPPPQSITEDDVAVVTEPTDQSERERGGKKKKKAKGTVVESESTSKEQTPFQAFDYTKAPSVLKGGDKREERLSKAFNPYKSGAGGPKGGKKGRREKAGKSATFRK